MDNRSDLLFKTLKQFYTDDTNAKHLNDILHRREGISLRTLEWFIINYCKKKNVTYETKTGRKFSVHVAYKASLDGYSKKLFDPFCRTQRIEFDVEGVPVKTTVAQLNFIKWCIVNNIIDYIKDQKISNHEKKRESFDPVKSSSTFQRTDTH